MILSDADILDRLAEGDLVVEPLDDVDQQVQPASVDLRLGERFLEFQRTNIPCIHPTEADEVGDYVTETRVPRARSSSSTRATSCSGPPRSASRSRRTCSRPCKAGPRSGGSRSSSTPPRGSSIRGTRGRSRSNCRTSAPRPSRSRPGCASHSSSSRSSKSPAKRPYGVERGSKYQDQDGPQASRIGSDPEFHSDENQAAEHES